jgi:hypothetical protein
MDAEAHDITTTGMRGSRVESGSVRVAPSTLGPAGVVGSPVPFMTLPRCAAHSDR